MTTWFISRHPGAIEWSRRQGLVVDEYVAHLDPLRIRAGDTVLGSLPVHLAARVCAAGGRYHHLSVDVPENLRGCELSADDLDRLCARLQAFDVRPDQVAR